MKIVRIDAEADDITYGAVEPDGIRLFHGSPFFQWERSETVLPITQVKLLAPVIALGLVAAACAIFVSFTYVAGQMRGVGVVFFLIFTVVIGWIAKGVIGVCFSAERIVLPSRTA